MANPSFPIPDEKLEEFDRIISMKKAKGELPMDTSRSEVIRQLVEEYIEGNGSISTAIAATAD
jgi:metal-responsive CopG/Arc/MetJ family transcriptional regulator